MTRVPNMNGSLRLCSHLVAEHMCLDTRHKIVLFPDARTQGTGTYFSVRIQGLVLVLGHRHRARIPAWIKGAFTLVPRENRIQAPCSGTKCEYSLRLRSD